MALHSDSKEVGQVKYICRLSTPTANVKHVWKSCIAPENGRGQIKTKQVCTWHNGANWKNQNELKNEKSDETNAKKLIYLLYRVKKDSLKGTTLAGFH